MNRLIPTVLMGAALLSLWTGTAFAHAHLKAAEPAVGSTVAAPSQLKLHYTQGVETAFSGVTLTDAAGKAVAGTAIASDPADKNTMVVSLPAPLPAGTYTVSWHATSVDTHKTEGTYQITVVSAGQPIPPIQISQAWARATVGSLASGIVYATIRNTGAADDQLVAASTPAARLAELHRTVEEKGVSSMPPVAGIDVKAGGEADLAPSGFHVMLIDLKAPLVAGQTLPLTLTFAHAGKVEVTVQIEKISASGPGADDMAGMKM